MLIMRTSILFTCTILLTTAFAAPIQSPGNWVLSWSDEFNGSDLDTTFWTAYNNQTHGDLELQLYLDDNVYVENGTLVLRTQRQRAMYGSKEYNFTSGWVDTENKFSQQYGRFEVRAKLPAPEATGIWPAHWLMPEANSWNCWPVGGEIDIMEATGGENNNTVYGTYHYGKNCSSDEEAQASLADPKACTCGCGCDLRSGPNGQDGQKTHTDFSKDFHEFAVEWFPDHITWFVDGVSFWERSSTAKEGIPAVPIADGSFYVILNTAIDWWNKQSGEGVYPVYHYIDYVRVYKWVQ